MGRRSSIEQLPQSLFDAINEALEAGKTLDQVVEHMRTLGAQVSRSALGRYKKNIDEVAERIRKSRMIAEAIGKEFTDQPDDKLASVNIELMHDQVLRYISAGEDSGEASMDSKQLREVSDALFRLAAARKLDAERIMKVRKEVAEKAAAKTETELKKLNLPGLTKDTIKAIREQVLGVAG